MVRWFQPDFVCATGGEAEIESTVVQPRRKSPYAFSAGKHVIRYTYNLKGGVSVTCPVTITVKGEHNHGRVIVKSVVEPSMKYSVLFSDVGIPLSQH